MATEKIRNLLRESGLLLLFLQKVNKNIMETIIVKEYETFMFKRKKKHERTKPYRN